MRLNDDANALVCETAEAIRSLPFDQRNRLGGLFAEAVYFLGLHGRKSSAWCHHYEILGFLRDEAVQLRESYERAK